MIRYLGASKWHHCSLNVLGLGCAFVGVVLLWCSDAMVFASDCNVEAPHESFTMS